jgi:NifU-like protein involved in Fe-S cluster formation
MQLSIRVENGVIEEAKFLAYGCAPTLVCGSVLTELVRAKNASDAADLTKHDLLEAVGGLPSRKGHAAALAIETLHAALAEVKR